MIAGTVLLVAFSGCVELQQLMIPDSDPDARFRYNFGTDDSTSEDGNDNVNEDDEDTESDMDSLIDEINAGNVGDIPAIASTLQQVQTNSGLRYFDVQPGVGGIPQQNSTVTVNYTGWLAEDGTQFDSNNLAQFNLQSVIPGWTEGLSTMQVGGTRRLIIPPDLAYGSRGSPPKIPADAWLVFDVELLEFD
jgi:peptidylprolyl isomerase